VEYEALSIIVNKNSVADLDPGSGVTLTRDPGWVKIRIWIGEPDPGDEQPGSYF
jgi:hypothetical protein